MDGYRHLPVLVEEIVQFLAPRPEGIYVDCTVGGGGHARALLEAGAGVVLGLDRDLRALAAAEEALASFGDRARLVRADFRDLAAVLAAQGMAQVHGILADLGVSSHQIDTAERGFSYIQDGPLDMRMDPQATVTAADLVNRRSEQELTEIFQRYGEEPFARRIARFIVLQRIAGPVTTTGQLVAIIRAAVPTTGRGHPAKRVFQALRIAVNQELAALESLLEASPSLLLPGGRIAIISYHSLEDRMVKESFRRAAAPCRCPPDLPECRCGARPSLRVLTRRPCVPSGGEQQVNPRSRGAKLRVAERL